MRFAILALIAVTAVHTAAAAPAPLIPRADLFRPPDRDQPAFSPDGATLSYLARSSTGALNVWTRPLEARSPADTARMVTHETARDVAGYRWAPDGRHILYLRDGNGDENNHVIAVDVSTGVARDLTSFDGVRAE